MMNSMRFMPPHADHVQAQLLTHTVCNHAQHDDSAEMIVDGVSLYREEASAWSAAGFKQFCTPVALAPGWHDLTLTYGSGPAGAASVLRFFVIDAAGVDAVQAGGQTTYEITWKVIPFAMRSTL